MKIFKFLNKANIALLSIILIGAYILIIAFDCRIEIINPPDEPVDVPVNLTVYLEDSENSRIPIMKIALYLRCEGTVVAEREIKLSGYGSILAHEAMNVTYVALGFQSSLAYPASNESGYPATSPLYLNHPQGTTFLLENSTSIYFPNSGDYPPTCAVHFGDEVKTGTFDITSIDVEPESQLSVEKFNRITVGLSFAVIYFTILEASYLYIDYRNQKKTDTKETILLEIKRINEKLDSIIKNHSSNQNSNSDKTEQEKQK